MRVLCCFCLLVFSFSIEAFAQTDSVGIDPAQKDFKRALIKHTKSVYAVDYSGCNASIKVVTGFVTSPLARTTFSPPQGFAGFPADAFTPDFTPEPRALGKSIRYLLDLAKLDPNKIAVTPGRGKTSLIALRAGGDRAALRTKSDKKIESVDAFFVVTATKSAAKTAAAMKAVIERCSAAS